MKFKSVNFLKLCPLAGKLIHYNLDCIFYQFKIWNCRDIVSILCDRERNTSLTIGREVTNPTNLPNYVNHYFYWYNWKWAHPKCWVIIPNCTEKLRAQNYRKYSRSMLNQEVCQLWWTFTTDTLDNNNFSVSIYLVSTMSFLLDNAQIVWNRNFPLIKISLSV